jgi:hypothetical protein
MTCRTGVIFSVPAVVSMVVLALAPVASAGTPPAPPVVTKVAPLKPVVGDTLTITGSHFVPGQGTNVIAFQRSGLRAVFIPAGGATTGKLTVRISAKLVPFFRNLGGKPVSTRFRLRVLSRRFARTFTAVDQSPVISPNGPTGTPPVAGCVPNYKSSTADSDADGLPDVLEKRIGTDPCRADTDGDGVPDGYEYWAAKDLNSSNVPYPGARPYPNALYPDAVEDHDGDGLTLAEEYAAWVRYGDGRVPLDFSSDGSQDSGGVVLSKGSPLDLNHDGRLTDGERDYDGDGLGNWVEAHGPMTQAWWWKTYGAERAYPASYSQLDWLDRDTNGNGIIDGNDDQDHDGYSNRREVFRGGRWVQPYNPCLPDWHAGACSVQPPADNPWPPFKSLNSSEATPLVWPRAGT